MYMYMGRKLKYKTEKEQIEARKTRQMKYYELNKQKIKIKNLKRYYENKINTTNQNKT
jgi:hypothetical protein